MKMRGSVSQERRKDEIPTKKSQKTGVKPLERIPARYGIRLPGARLVAPEEIQDYTFFSPFSAETDAGFHHKA